jgi:hypothetical protein
MAVVLTVAFSPWTKDIAFLWHNLIGAVVVVLVGLTVSAIAPEHTGLKAKGSGLQSPQP